MLCSVLLRELVAKRRQRQRLSIALLGLTLAGIVTGASTPAACQNLNWDGQSGIFVTPFAYTAPSDDRGLGRPVVAYHYVNAGEVLGGFHQISVTEGAWNRVELGYTRNLHNEGGTAVLSSLWGSGFNTFHGKVKLLGENFARQPWVPAVAIGFAARTQVRNVGGALSGQNTNNADFYAVATKTITQIRKLPLVFTFGYKATNASLLGLAGNAPAYRGRAFGSAVAVLKGPGHSTLMLASEVLQQPPRVEGLPEAVIPTTITYAVRIVPAGAFPYMHGWGEEKPKFSVDLGVAQVAGNVLPNVNLRARHQFALGISYGF